MLYFGSSPEGEGGQTSVQRLTPTPTQTSRGKDFYRQREGLGAGTARSALTVLALALGGLRGVICVKHRGPSVPGLVCLHFFEASSQT